jgi:hypothetical protein
MDLIVPLECTIGAKKSERGLRRETHYNNETTLQYLVKHTMKYFTHTEAAEIELNYQSALRRWGVSTSYPSFTFFLLR